MMMTIAGMSMSYYMYIDFILFLSDKVEVICVSDDDVCDSDVVVTVIGKYRVYQTLRVQ